MVDHNEAVISEFKRLGHVPIVDKDGHIDIFVLDAGNHNGPGCSVCGVSFCHHCEDVDTLDDEVGKCIGAAGVAKRNAEWHRKRIADAIDLLTSEGYGVTPPAQKETQ